MNRESQGDPGCSTSEIEVTMLPLLTQLENQRLIRSMFAQTRTVAGELSIPAHVTDISVFAYYSPAHWGYVNCDSVRDRTRKDHWYTVSQILSTGVAAQNY